MDESLLGKSPDQGAVRAGGSPAWLQREGREGGRWVRIHEADEERLEAALLQAARSKAEAGKAEDRHPERVVALCGGRKEAELTHFDESTEWSATLASRFDEAPNTVLARSTWCYRPWPNGQWTPFAAEDDGNLERVWQMATEGDAAKAERAGIVTLDGRHRVTLKRMPDGSVAPTMRPVDATQWQKIFSWTVERGWAGDELPPRSDEEVESERGPPHALVLVVHGIGERMWSRGGGASLGINSIADSAARLRALAAASQARVDPALRRRTEFLPVEWHQTVHGVDDRTARTVTHITPQSVPLLRQFANEVILDVLLYEQQAHRSRIQTAVASRINGILREWRVHNPTFDAGGGQVVLLGHSLGSLICFDLLGLPLTPDAASTPAAPDAPDAASTSATPPAAPDAASTSASPPAAPDAASPPASPPELLCRPAACIAIGAPVACFLALRGAALGPSFVLPRCPRYYNLFHRNDPVAYRLEPLLQPDPACDSAAQLPAPAYVPFAGDKGGERLHVKLRRTVKESRAAVEGVGSAVASTAQEETEIEMANEYLSALQAHSAYFENADVAQFIVDYVLAPPAPDDDAHAQAAFARVRANLQRHPDSFV